MQKESTPKRPHLRVLLPKCFAALLAIVLLMQSAAVGICALAENISFNFGKDSSASVTPSGIAKLDVDEVTAQLKKDFFKSMNKNLVKKISDYELRGTVGLIITFSEDSLVAAYARSEYAKQMTYEQFKDTAAAKSYASELTANQNKVLDQLLAEGFINEVRYNYVHIADGAFVKTTYDMIEKISAVDGVERIMISNTYLPAAAVENPVDVYDTGIFNSGSVDYTGKGTVVAILDTGCDYSHSAFNSYEVQSPYYNRDMIADLLEKEDFKAEEFTVDLEAREVYYGNITGNKIAFGYDYADKDPDIMPFENSHGTHVAGIIAGKDDKITGVAIDAQLAIMKVFSDYDAGAEEGDIIAALEDSVILGVDAINMSLGTSCGFTYESAPDKVYKNEVYSRIEQAGISLVVAASNDYSSGFGSEQGNTNKTDNPDSATVGSPSTYTSAMSVASISGKKDNYMLANGNEVIFFTPSVDTAAKEYDFFEMLGITKGDNVTYEYVTVPGVGMKVNYASLDVVGKIALVKRGDITFEEKVQFAAEAGAIAVIIYNNVFGDITMTIGNDAKIPAVSIGKDEGDKLAAHESGTLEFNLDNVAGPFMSDFSSWGPNPDLSLKPEITAHGGNILSAVVGGEYDELSGTSMAAPNMCGITVLIRQYVKETFPELSATEVRDLVNQLTMSTATIALDQKGNPYSPRKQGAGIADIAKSTTTPAYLHVDGINKTKLELWDDPERTGVYKMSINLTNLSDRTLSYKLGNITMTESVSASDPEYVAEMAYLLSNSSEYSVEGGTLENGIVSVAAGQTAKVNVTLTLSAEDKSYLNATFANGMYVEGFLTFTSTEENGIDLNAPFLAFYGDWGEAPLFDLDYYEVETEAHNDAIDDDEKIKADYYATTPLGTYYYDYIIPLGSYVYEMDKSKYTAIPATQEKAAVSYYADAISGIYGVFTGLLRGAKELSIQMVDTSTGKVVWEDVYYNCYKAHYYGSPYPYAAHFDLPAVNYETGEVLGNNNAKIEVTMSAKLDWEGGDNISDTYSFSFYIDYEAPTVINSNFRTEYDKGREENRYYLDLTVYDNHYAMSVRPIAVYEIWNPEKEDIDKTYSMLTEYPIPIYQTNRGENTVVTIELTDYLDIIADSTMPNGVTLYIDDYAMNASITYVPFPSTAEDGEDLEFMEDEIELDINETFDLTKFFVYEDTTKTVNSDYLHTLKWEVGHWVNDVWQPVEDVIAIDNGQIEALNSGTAIVRVTSDSWITKTTANGVTVNIPTYKYLTIHVSETVITDNPNSGDNVLLESLEFVSYKTLFAFNSDIDYSEIGITDSVHYFDGNYSISCYPSEQIQLTPLLKPWNISEDRYTLSWSSSNPKVATVDENGIVTAEAEGNTRITLKITIDGKTSTLAARLSVEVKSEFIIENRTLVAYKGKGGDVVIPDDEGIIYIGDFAFSHYDLDNEKEVEKDENGYYDFDEKKSAIGNTTVTSVVIPEGVETINQYAFYNCTALRSVTLPDSCKQIGEHAFEDCVILENVNFDHVKIVSDYAFNNCKSLSCEEIGGANTSAIYTVGKFGFASTRFSSLSLVSLARISESAFANCSKLTTVELGPSTRISAKMFENSGLTSVTVYADSIDDDAFAGSKNLKSVTIVNDMTYLGARAFDGCTRLESIVIEKNLEKIGDYAFRGCEKLTDVKLPDGKISIGDGAFESCKLITIKLSPNTELAYIGISPFSGYRTAVSIDVTDSALYIEENGVIYNKDKSTLVLVIPDSSKTEFVVPASVVTIGSGAFSSLNKLKKVEFAPGSQLTTIEQNAFGGCSALSTVLLPARAISVKDYAFYATSNLREMDLSNVTEIGMYAFATSDIKSADLSNVVKIGAGAFFDTKSLKSVTIGPNATIGDYAFANSAVETVDLLGDAVIGDGAFSACVYLTFFDFSEVTGKIGDFAFYQCLSLTSVIAPYVTELGDAAFSDCARLSEFSAERLEKIGNNAFAPNDEKTTYMNQLVSVNLPALTYVGDYAFYGSLYLQSIDLSKVTFVGEGAFALCEALESVTLTDTLKEVPTYTFYGCTALANIDLSHLVKIGEGAFCAVRLPEHLSLDNAEHIDGFAFVEILNSNGVEFGTNNVVSVYAPKLTYLGEQAFASCKKLASVTAPALESIGYGAFAYTAIEQFEIGDSLKDVDFNLFEGSESFTGFVNSEGLDTATLENVVIDKGVLYVKSDKGYILTAYPTAKEDSEYTVIEGTVRIEFGAALGNKNLEKVILPSTLKYIGNYAFNGCEKLNTVVFKSYYAPVLEGTMTGQAIKITFETIADYPGFDDLYKYDFYYLTQSEVALPYYYGTFIGTVGHKSVTELIAIIPDNAEGYESLIYNAYFTISEETSGINAGKYADAFIEAVSKLPAEVDRFDTILVNAAITAYNALERHSEELAFVDESVLTTFNNVRKAYNVDVAEGKIAHLFDMDKLEYCFNSVKDAKKTYDALTAEEKELVTNASVLDEKIAALNALYGKTVDFSLSYAENIGVEENDTPTEEPEPTPEGLAPWIIVLIVVGSVLVVGGAATATVILMKRKKQQNEKE